MSVVMMIIIITEGSHIYLYQPNSTIAQKSPCRILNHLLPTLSFDLRLYSDLLQPFSLMIFKLHPISELILFPNIVKILTYLFRFF